MYDFLAVDVDYNIGRGPRSHRLYVSGQSIVTWINEAAAGAFNTAAGPTGAGTQDNPYQLNGVADWLAVWKVTKTARDRHLYYRIGGRVIQKIARGGIAGGFADGYYMRDVAFSGTDPTVSEGSIWSRKDGASYREFGKFIDQGNTISTMEGVVWSQRLGSQLRTILKGRTGAHAGSLAAPMTRAATAARADTLSALPMLAAAMFLAEPSRNARAWVVGLMMLDLLGLEYQGATSTHNAKHLTLQRAFANPTRLTGGWTSDTNRGTDSIPLSWVQAQTRDRRTINKLSQPGSAAVEGLYPPSPKWSGRTSSNADVANDYIQQKEAGVAARWIAEEFNRYVGRPVFMSAELGIAGTRVDMASATFPDETAMNNFGTEATQIIKTLITRRASSFDTPGMLFR